MFNVGGPEVLVILIVALVVLGPSKLPEAARQISRTLGEIRKVSDGFRREVQSAFEEPTAVLQPPPLATPAPESDDATVSGEEDPQASDTSPSDHQPSDPLESDDRGPHPV